MPHIYIYLEILYSQYGFAFYLPLILPLPINTSIVVTRENTIDATEEIK